MKIQIPQDVLDGNIDQFIEEELKTNNEKNFSYLFIFLSYYSYFISVLSTIGLKLISLMNIIYEKFKKEIKTIFRLKK